MDNQLEWIRNVLEDTKNNPSIEHVFMFAHEPAFPNGGHLQDAQWHNGGDPAKNKDYGGNPLDRAYVVERRDELWEAISQNGKVVAVFFGDEHNYNRASGTANQIVLICLYSCNFFAFALKVYLLHCQPNPSSFYGKQ